MFRSFLKWFFVLLLSLHLELCFAQWLHQNSGTDVSLGWIYFLNANTGWIVGNSGTILKTTNSGRSWTAVSSITTENLAQVYFINSNIGWICGESGIILKTTNEGLNWEEQFSGTNNNLIDIQFFDNKTGWIVGGDNTNNFTLILKTTDGGKNWIKLKDDTGPFLYSLYFLDANLGWAAGDFSKIIKTTDGGENWISQYEGSKQAGFHSIFFIDSNNGWAVGWDGVMMRTTNGGNSWLVYSRGIGVVWVDVFFVNSDNGWIVGFDYVGYPRMIRSSDGGNNWFLQNLPISAGLNSIYFTDINTGWAAGYQGTILHTSNGGSNFNRNSQIDDEMPDQFPISQDYEDGNSSTILSYPVPQSSQIQIRIFDLFGNDLKKLSQDDKNKFGKDTLNVKEIDLAYDQNNIRLEFVTHYYSYPIKNRYKYKLENFDKNWIDAGTQKTATYTNLDPGEYLFKVIESNLEGDWKKEAATLEILINPPFWATTWAYMFYALAFISLVSFTWKLQLKRIRVKQEFEMSRFEAKKLHEVDEMKSRFFTNISHEFRTPLTLILGPVKQMIEKLNEGKMKDDLSLVHRNANKLLGLVNQLLDISKIESGNMKLQTIPQNFIPLLKALVLSFTSYAERKQITLKFNSSEDEITVYLDREKIEKIFTNLLSNAFKFTPNGGNIETRVTIDNSYLKVEISDTGIGIAKEKLKRIFDRFYQVDGSHTREQEGTGIGLSLTKELVELHKGKIEVESEEGKGTTFTISLLLGKDHLKPDEISEREPEVSQVIPEIGDDISNTDTSKILLENLKKDSFPLLLIVEDNKDVRYYIKDNLQNHYRIVEAIDGEDGWNKSVEQIPDLIISDVMMPKMDGFKLCEKLKTDERTSHIPVILLTAKAAKSDKLEGYEIGADEYVMKPFEPDELRARIKNLIAQRKRLQEHFQKQGIAGLNQQKITSVDKKFLEKLFQEINTHISDSSFSVEMMANELAISRSVLHRKVQSLTGETPGDLIRRVRLNKAAELIKQKFGNFSEIALEVGFNNPAYFSESFKKQFGVSPSQYQQKKTNN